MSEQLSSPVNDRGSKDIAIVGMASLFPEAENLTQFWDNIVHEIDCIIDVPASRWKIDDYYDPDPRAPDKVYCKRGGFLPDIDFDPLEFGIITANCVELQRQANPVRFSRTNAQQPEFWR